MTSRSLFDSTVCTATFSLCRRYRYTLSRIWNWDVAPINFLMLNPSTADEVENDPTVERCERRARMGNFGGLIVTNIFAWRATDPAELALVEDPVGPDNDEALVEVAMRANIVVCGWGNHGALYGRGEAVRRRLAQLRPLHVLRLTKKSNMCEHPLYIPYSCTPKVWSLSE